MKHIPSLALCLALSLAGTAYADTTTVQGTRMHIHASAEQLLPNDEVVVLYRIEAMGTSADSLRRKVNKISHSIHQQLNNNKNLKQTTLSRRMNMRWRYDRGNQQQVRDGWQLIQREQITSKHLDAVSAWVDMIEQAGGHLDNLSFRIASETTKKAREKLRFEAITQFRQQANAMAKALDAESFQILSLQSSTNRPNYPVRREVMMMKDTAGAAPTLHTGEGKISVHVDGEILLPKKEFSVR